MNISIFGMGYVGCIVAGCLADSGHNVIGVDINDEKVKKLNRGECPVNEAGLQSRIEDAVSGGSLRATTNGANAVLETDISYVSVGTPLEGDERISMTNLYAVIDAIADGIEEKSGHTIVIRSTVLPGTTGNLREYLSGKIEDMDGVNFVVNPEFLREGSAIQDFYNPPYVVLGGRSKDALEYVESIYREVGVDADVHYVDERTAEMLKIVNNAFHALKITFANEVGSIAAQYGVNGRKLMELVCEDTKLNISDEYLTPGMAYGGSCLPKDTRTLASLADKQGVDTPVVDNIEKGNDSHLDRIAAEVGKCDGDSVGIVGLSFKQGTNDMRNSPALRLIERLDCEEINIYEKDVDLKQTIGANREYIDRVINENDPNSILDPEEFLSSSDIVIFTNSETYPELVEKLDSQTVIDPMGAVKAKEVPGTYRTVSW